MIDMSDIFVGMEWEYDVSLGFTSRAYGTCLRGNGFCFDFGVGIVYSVGCSKYLQKGVGLCKKMSRIV